MTRSARRLGPEERREQILAAAIAYFAEVGLGGTTRELAERAGITQALLYRYFENKAGLLEAVYDRVFLDRLDPRWEEEIRDRALPVPVRLEHFYAAYTGRIFTYEWMRIFMWSGLAGTALNRRYLTRVGSLLLEPLREEIGAAGPWRIPEREEMWALHGSIVYLGIRRFIYGLDTPDDVGAVLSRSVARFLAGLERAAPGPSEPDG